MFKQTIYAPSSTPLDLHASPAQTQRYHTRQFFFDVLNGDIIRESDKLVVVPHQRARYGEGEVAFAAYLAGMAAGLTWGGRARLSGLCGYVACLGRSVRWF